MDIVEIEGFFKDIFEYLVIDLMGYEKLIVIKLRDIKFLEGIKIIEDLDEVVVVIDVSEIIEELEEK